MPERLRAILRSLHKSLRRRGVMGTIVQSGKEVAERLQQYSPARRRSRARREAADRAFDEQFGVDTGGIIPLSRLEIDSAQWEGGCAYQGIDPGLFRDAFARVPLRHEDFVFVDFGSGKGRALMLAADMPFRRIIGVEFAPQLHRIAAENIHRFQAKSGRGANIELCCGDAVEFPIPPDKLVIYFYNPFEKDVMGRTIDNIRRSYEASPRAMYVFYLTPDTAAQWDELPFLRKVVSTASYAVWKTIADERGAANG